MQFTITIHDSWATIPVALSRILVALTALERPRQPGDDGDDLAQLLDGIDAPEPSPAAPAAARPSPARATPPARPSFDGTPRTGKSLYRWACDHKSLPKVNAIGKLHGYPKLVSDWADHEVAAAYAILTAEPAANGQAPR